MFFLVAPVRVLTSGVRAEALLERVALLVFASVVVGCTWLTRTPPPSPSATSDPCIAEPSRHSVLHIFVANRDQARYVLEIVGAGGPCHWEVPTAREGGTGGLSVPASNENRIRLRRAADCAVVHDRTVRAGDFAWVLEIRGGRAELIRHDEGTDSEGFGPGPGPPCHATR